MSDSERRTLTDRWATIRFRLQQWICGLTGHAEVLHFDEGRLLLLCTSCLHESPGLDLRKRVSGTHAAPLTRGHSAAPTSGATVRPRPIA